MIEFNNLSKEIPYLIFKDRYEKSIIAKQKNVEAVCIASYSSKTNETNARFVNLKFINNKEFIFFSNYGSPKSIEFTLNDQIAAIFFWNEINTQIRIKASIKKTSRKFNELYFAQREKKKNALAISSNQSKKISSYNKLLKNYEKSLLEDNLSICPEHWGGFSFIPYYFEFWEGHEFRLNKRDVYEYHNEEWKHSYLQP